MTVRLFAAISVPDEIAERLAPLQRDVFGARWRPREALHVTLRFFGDLREDVARDLDHELAQIRATPFEISLSGMGSFGGREPDALWAGVAPSDPLKHLAKACERAARRAGLAPEPRKFTPHVTLAYCKGTTDRDAALFLAQHAEFVTAPFWVEQFALYSSWQTKATNSYVEEVVYPLSG
jgi:2'-5' RNA ligase